MTPRDIVPPASILPGLALGLAAFAASLTPSLIPRDAVVQGGLAGACLAIGLGLWQLARWLWLAAQLPAPSDRAARRIGLALVVPAAVLSVWNLAQVTPWQNSIHAVMGLPPVETARPWLICAIALPVAAVGYGIGRAIVAAIRIGVRLTGRVLPPRTAAVLGAVLALFVVWTLANTLMFRTVLRALDASYRQIDALIQPDQPPPADPTRAGSPASLVAWDDLGREGRAFVASGPTRDEIAATLEQPALSPIRIYVGLPAAETPEDRAALALRDLIRAGGFERSVLVIVTPTGTGWVDPAGIAPAEYLAGGDIASVAVQYSYLSSPLSLLVEPDYGAETAQALFRAVHGHWSALPRDNRPRLYLHGLSLGALNSARSAALIEMLDDPIHGAVWSGPPFASTIWQEATRSRLADSPVWLPRLSSGKTLRFANQTGFAENGSAPWGPMRLAFLQYASDAITFFDPRDLYRPPQWLAPRGPDVSPHVRWYPVVTLLQTGVDMLLANRTPAGHGHVYAPEHYLATWAAVLGPVPGHAALDRIRGRLDGLGLSDPNRGG